MSTDQPCAPDFVTAKDELAHSLEGVEAAIQSAIRNDDDKDWLVWLQKRRDELQEQLAKEQAE